MNDERLDMIKIRQIKIIRGAERNQSKGASVGELVPTAASNSTELVERRAVVATVTRWVGELRQQKEAEAAQSYKISFEEAA